MSQLKVDEVICIKGSVLIVFYTPGKCWEFRIISCTGGIFGEQKIFYTAEAALKASFQEELLKNGLAKTRKSEVKCPNQLAFEQAQKMAIASKAGVWK
jgi:Staphylococcal nuclease homologue